MPMAFWFFSMGGGLMTLIYGIAKREPVIISANRWPRSSTSGTSC